MTAARRHFIGSMGLTLAALALQCGRQPSAPAPSTPSNAAKASTALHDVESDFRSGTRLLAKVLRVAGTQEEAHIGWHDKDLATDCTFEPASDGAKRCLPTTRFETEAFFADAGCKVRVAVTFPSQPCTSRFARASEGHCDDFRERVFPAQDEQRDIATVFQRDSDQRCTPKPLKGEHVFRLGAEIAASRFVEGRSSMEESASVTTEYVNTSDGARAFVTLRDPRHGNTPCTLFDNGATWACEPTETKLVEDGIFSGLDCSQRLVSGCTGYLASELVPGDAGADASSVACDEEHYFEIGTKVTSQYALLPVGTDADAPSTCQMQATYSAPWESFFAVGKEVERADLIPGHPLAVTDPTARIVRPRLGTPAPGLVVPSVRWHEHKYNSTCDFRHAVDGTLRCIPSYATLGETFEDVACTVPIHVKRCGAVPRVFVRSTDTCSDALRIFEVGARVEKAWTYRREAGNCVRVYQAPVAYRVGAEIEPSAFVSAIESVR